MSLVNKICGSFIYMFPKYKKMWIEVVSFNKRYPNNKEYTYSDFFIHNVGIGVFFSDYHYPRGFFHKLFYYIGCKSGWLKQHHQECIKNFKIARKSLEQAFEPQLLKLLEEQINE